MGCFYVKQWLQRHGGTVRSAGEQHDLGTLPVEPLGALGAVGEQGEQLVGGQVVGER